MRQIVVVLAALVVVHASGFEGWGMDSPGPAASPVGAEYRFDPVPEGTNVTHEYLIRNTGDAVLSIEAVKTG
jgi:hypothetical protein